MGNECFLSVHVSLCRFDVLDVYHKLCLFFVFIFFGMSLEIELALPWIKYVPFSFLENNSYNVSTSFQVVISPHFTFV